MNFRLVVSIGILLNYLSSCNTLKTGLIAYYPLDNDNVQDFTKYQNHGNKHGNLISSINRHNKINSCIEFDGRDSYIRVKDNDLLRIGSDSTKSFSISLWYYSFGSANQYVNWIITKGMSRSSSSIDYGLCIQNAATKNKVKKLQWSIGPSGVGDTCAFTQLEPLEDKVWQHIVLVVDPNTSNSGTKSIYVNGNLYHQCNYKFKVGFRKEDLLFGAGNSNIKGGSERYFYGKIDDIYIYNRVLKEKEILKLRNL